MHIHAAKWMKTRRVCAVVLALTLVFISFFVFPSPARAETDGMVRVRLTRLGAPDAVTLKADCDYYLASDPTVRIRAGERMTVSAAGDIMIVWCLLTYRSQAETVVYMDHPTQAGGVIFEK